MTQTAKIEVFTSPTCPHCPHAKKAAFNIKKKRDDVKVIETSTHTSRGQKRSRNLQIRSVPTLIITGPGTDENIGFVGTPSESQLNKMLDIAIGKKNWDEPEKKEGIFSRLKKIKIKF
jgi:glutaredoxin